MNFEEKFPSLKGLFLTTECDDFEFVKKPQKYDLITRERMENNCIDKR